MKRILTGSFFILLLAFATSCTQSATSGTTAEAEHPWPAFESIEEELHGAVNGGATNMTAITTGLNALLDGGIPDSVTNNELVKTIFADIKTFDLSGTPPVEDLHSLLAELAHEAGLPHDCEDH